MEQPLHHIPDYPPKTPPPPKKPVQPPRPPIPPAGTLVPTHRRGVTMTNRQGANWPLESQPWSAPVARRRVVAQLQDWGYGADHKTAGSVTALLVDAAVGDGGTRVSVHLADQNRQALILVLSHQPGQAPADDALLPSIAALGVASCGTDTAADGRRRWAVIDL